MIRTRTLSPTANRIRTSRETVTSTSLRLSATVSVPSPFGRTIERARQPWSPPRSAGTLNDSPARSRTSSTVMGLSRGPASGSSWASSRRISVPSAFRVTSRYGVGRRGRVTAVAGLGLGAGAAAGCSPVSGPVSGAVMYGHREVGVALERPVDAVDQVGAQDGGGRGRGADDRDGGEQEQRDHQLRAQRGALRQAPDPPQPPQPPRVRRRGAHSQSPRGHSVLVPRTLYPLMRS